MDRKIINFCLAAVLSSLVQVSSQYGTYRGAVVEYSPVVSSTDKLTMAANVKNYVAFMEKAAKEGVQIIVFPEGGLFGSEASPIPDPQHKIAPWKDTKFETTETVKELSLASKNNGIYSVVNLREKRNCAEDDENCPSANFYIFNTNVVFDPSGVVIARYSKYNLFDESNMSRTKDPEIVFFDTNFGVRFGVFTCFDILFSTPPQRLVQQYQIKDFVFPTFWFSELPFLTALQAQRGWAESNDVNLLASGVNFLSRGSSGSGIYNGRYGQLVQFIAKKTTSKLLIADIPIHRNGWFSDARHEIEKRETTKTFEITEHFSNFSHFPAVIPEKDESSLMFLEDVLTSYTSKIIETDKIFEETICGGKDFCCDFYVSVDALTPQSQNYTYRALAFNGIRNFGISFRGGIQTCGLVLCDGPHITNCTHRVEKIPGLFRFKEIRIKGNFKLRNSMQIPSTLTDGEEVIPLPATKYEFTKTEKRTNLEVSLELLWPVINLRTFAIFGRDFTRDMEPQVPESTASATVSIPVLFLAFVGFVLYAR